MRKIKRIAALMTALMIISSAGCSSGSKDDSGSEKETAAQTGETAAAETEAEEPETKEPRSIKLMCMGDSITDGFWLPGGYRITLEQLLKDNDLIEYVDFVGRKKVGDLDDNECEGYTGYAIDSASPADTIDGSRMGLSKMAGPALEANQPDVILLMIGTNDILSQYKLDEAGDRLGSLVDICLDGLSEDGKLYVATIPVMDATDNTYIPAEYFTVETMDGFVADYNEKVKAVVEERANAGKSIELADVNSVLTKEDLYDGVHPNEEGYKKLGEFWYGIVSDHITNY